MTCVFHGLIAIGVCVSRDYASQEWQKMLVSRMGRNWVFYSRDCRTKLQHTHAKHVGYIVATHTHRDNLQVNRWWVQKKKDLLHAV